MNTKPVIIALDAMGGDLGPDAVVPAALQALYLYPHLQLILVGNQTLIDKSLHQYHGVNCPRLHVLHASEIVAMDEKPSIALRNKKDSSMRVAINLVKEGKAQACVSSGNTGALMAMAKFVLKTLPGIDRPAIMARFPTIKKNTLVRVLDLGANIDSTAENLLQFALMGTVIAKAVGNIAKPSVGLLNVGEEEMKGNSLVQEAAVLLDHCPGIHYIGFVEGDDIFKGAADIVVCDGFVGNVMLKTTEGVLKMLSKYVKDAFMQNWFSKLAALLIMPIAKKIGKSLDPSEYNGASLLGLNGIVVKSHGSANQKSFLSAIHEAMEEVERDVSGLLREEIAGLLQGTKENP